MSIIFASGYQPADPAAPAAPQTPDPAALPAPTTSSHRPGLDPGASAPVSPAQQQPDAAGQSAPAAGETLDRSPGQAPAEPTNDEDAALQTPQKPNRPFVSRLIRENERLKTEYAQREAQIAYLTQQLTARQSQPQPGGTDPRPAPTATSGSAPVSTPQERPRPEAFPSHEAWVEALADWRYDQREAQKAAQEASQRQAAAQQTAQQQWAQREREGRARYDDYDEAVSQLQIAPHVGALVADTVRESEHGADLLYYLGQHPEDQDRLNAMTPLAAARWLGQLELRVAPAPAGSNGSSPAGRDPLPKADPRATRGAPSSPAQQHPPAPMQPVGGQSSVPQPAFRSGMNLGDYERMRAAERQGRR